MTKSQQYFQDMLEYNKEVFDQFKEAAKTYDPETKSGQELFNEIGEKVLVVIRKYENLLCGHSESGKYGKFSDKTADTFWKYIRGAFPKIDYVGIKA